MTDTTTELDLTDDALVKRAEAQEEAREPEGSTDMAPAVEAPTTPTPTATAAPTPEAETGITADSEDDGDDESVVQLEDGSWVVGGKYKAGTLKEATAKALKAKREQDRNLREILEERNRLRAEREQFEQQYDEDDEWWQPEPQQMVAPVAGTDPAAQVANTLVAKQVIKNFADQGDYASATDAAAQLGDQNLYVQMLQSWIEEDPFAAQQYHETILRASAEIQAEQEQYELAAQQQEYQAYLEQHQEQEFAVQQQRQHAFAEGMRQFVEANPDANPESESFNPKLDAAIRDVIQRQTEEAHQQGYYGPIEQADGNPILLRQVMDAAAREARGIVGEADQHALVEQSKIGDGVIETPVASDLSVTTSGNADAALASAVKQGVFGNNDAKW